MSLTVTSCTDPDDWDREVNAAGGHPMQLWGWGQTKAKHNWSVDRVLVLDGAGTIGSAQILVRKLPFPFRSLAYIPRGPQAVPGRRLEVAQRLAEYARETRGSVALSIEPDWEVSAGDGADAADVGGTGPAGDGAGTADDDWQHTAVAAGWQQSSNTILIARTLILDLNQSAEDLQAQMSKTTRQNIRKSFKKDVQFRRVTTGEELAAIMEIYRETAERAGFGLHSDDYYRDIFDHLGAASPVLAAFDAEGPVAFVWLARSQRTAFELYGGVNERGQKLRINYGVKWYAIETMKDDGVERYDFNGLLNDGISDFKKQFARHENMLVGTWDKPLSPLYPLFARALPLARKATQKVLPAARGVLDRARPAAQAVRPSAWTR
ncbi:lipid II:glycine glycyltransferase FemX [Arthrobacter castelli]|uniref:lipid II:glycine glycyltransferase FemX n=1 Tax=Arthrobacter castelli TaxID=271431 RepID=UPI00041D930E|nr:peptidoglycan bridge formation glycyltransferase FemA/FemB family protein [Arthrobacter castelli]